MATGSDLGHVVVWDRWSGEVVMVFKGDRHVVNVVEEHPFLPLTLAVSGTNWGAGCSWRVRGLFAVVCGRCAAKA